MLALIDGDIVAYRCAAVNENTEAALACWQSDQLITRIIEDVNASDWKVFLSGDNNFRYLLFSDYKANRRDMVRPKHLEAVREHLVLTWHAVICDGYEADDALGIASREGGTVVCSIDKDLLQLAGTNYNFARREIKTIDALDAAKFFYTQLLVGDATDNIRGCPGIGKVKAERALKGCHSERDMFLKCVQLYWESLGNTFWDELFLNAQLLYVWRVENDQWQPPKSSSVLEPVAAVKQQSSGMTTSISMEPMMTVKPMVSSIPVVGITPDTSGLKPLVDPSIPPVLI